MTATQEPQAEHTPTIDECLDEGAPILARMFDRVYGVGQWRAPEPGELEQLHAGQRRAS